MAKKWNIDLFFEKHLGKYYETMPNGKKELLGIDGANHGLYAMLIAVAFGVVGFFGDKYYTLNTMLIGLVLVTIIFYFIEVGQEYVRSRKRSYHSNHLFWLKLNNAQTNDFWLPVLVYYFSACVIIIIKGLTDP